MKTIILSAFIGLSTISGVWPKIAMGNPVENWAWKYRPLVVYAPNNENELLANQRGQLYRLRDEMQERDMAVIEVVGMHPNIVIGPEADIDVSALMQHLKIQGDRFEVVFLGKDTGIKLRSETPVLAQDLFSLIDAMPMRRREMNQGAR